MKLRNCDKCEGTVSIHCRNKNQKLITEIRKKKDIKIIIQNLRHIIINLKAFFILHYSFKISRLLSVVEFNIISIF